MDHLWAATQLRVFVIKIDHLAKLEAADLIEPKAKRGSGPTASDVADELISLDPVIRDIMNAARAGFGDYLTVKDAGVDHYSSTYWSVDVKPWVLRAIGVHTLGAEARERLKPDSPDLAADQLHPWVWDAASPLWDAGSRQEAVLAAARSVNARLQQKLGRHDRSEAALCREAFSLGDPAPNRPRLRFGGDRTSDTWRSRQQGGIDFGAGCFEGIRNPAAHQDQLDLTERVALEQLAAISVLARWIDECGVETADESATTAETPGGSRG
jgi:hypothetical protein